MALKQKSDFFKAGLPLFPSTPIFIGEEVLHNRLLVPIRFGGHVSKKANLHADAARNVDTASLRYVCLPDHELIHGHVLFRFFYRFAADTVDNELTPDLIIRRYQLFCLGAGFASDTSRMAAPIDSSSR